MLAPDYQEFANSRVTEYPWQYRDLRFHRRIISRNRRNVARLSRRKSGTKAELSSRTATKKDRFGTFPPSSNR